MALSKESKTVPAVQEGERVLTFQGSVLREAECVRVAVEDRQVRYLVRYLVERRVGGAGPAPPQPHPSPPGLGGGSSLSPGHGKPFEAPEEAGPSGVGTGGGAAGAAPAREHPGRVACWNYEWVPESRVLRYGSAGEEAGASQVEDAPSTSSGAGPGGSGGDGAQPPEKHSSLGAPERKFLKKREVKVTLPDALKPLLVKDWELVTQDRKLFSLPARKPVDEILADYTASQQNCGLPDKEYAVHELVAGIKEYFNVMLGSQLLYKFERPQYVALVASHPHFRMSQLYGGAHLLRLFVQIGSMLAYTALDDSSLNMLLGHLHDFLRYLASKPSVLFTAADYHVASAEYQQRAQ